METKYGVISDVHEDPNVVPIAIEALKQKGAEKLLINGDIGEKKENWEESQQYTAFILNSLGKSGLESYIQPGSHETIQGYQPVIDYFSDKFSNIIDLTNSKNRKIEQNGHHLVFLPGSDFLCNGEYQIGNDEDIETGFYNMKGRSIFYSNMNDLKQLVTHPEKTIVVCHVPRKFDNIENCVDMAEFGENECAFRRKGNLIPGKTVFPLPLAKQYIDKGYPIEIKHENRGNEDLKDLYEELGITKAVTGHFHESSHRANDSNGNHVLQNTPTTDLFWNSGHLDRGYTGILTVNEENISYENIKLNLEK